MRGDRSVAQMIAEEKAKAKWFINQLIKKGVPRKVIATNDFQASLVPRVYITIPYGRTKYKGERVKGYARWDNNTVRSAVRWWKDALAADRKAARRG